MSNRPVPASRLMNRFPILQGLQPFQWSGVSKNLLAGFTLAAMNIPQSLGYTKIAGTPVITGPLHASASPHRVLHLWFFALSRGGC